MTSFHIPEPPGRLIDGGDLEFVPCNALDRFARRHFLNEKDWLFNEEHSHLNAAALGFLWTNGTNKRRGRYIAGEAEMPDRYAGMRLGKWLQGRLNVQLEQWFAAVPDFLITFDARIWNEYGPGERLALFEHELYHCGQQTDEFGIPQFSKSSGRPKFTIRGHDIEQFSGVVRRYGTEAAGIDSVDFVIAALNADTLGPAISPARLNELCGVCA